MPVLVHAARCSLRRLLGAGDWLVVSRGPDAGSVQGVLRWAPCLEEVQFQTMAEPTVLVVDSMAGARRT